MANLYEINKELMQLYDSMIDEETGEINGDLYEQFNALAMERDTKIENIACWIKNLGSDAEQLKAEAKALTERAKRAENKAESLKNYIKWALNGEKFSTSKVAISWRKTKSVECTLADISNLPNQFLRFKEPELNKTEVKKFIEEGGTVEGCSIVEKQSMTIK